MRLPLLALCLVFCCLVPIVVQAQCRSTNGCCPSSSVCQPPTVTQGTPAQCPIVDSVESVTKTRSSRTVIKKERVKAGEFHGGQRSGPRPPAPGPYGHHGNNWGQPHFNPVPYIINPIVNYATAPRMVPNPVTAQMEYRTPGRWTQNADGSWGWFVLPVWPLGSEKTSTACAAVPEVPVVATAGPAHSVIRAVAKLQPLRRVLKCVAALIKHRPHIIRCMREHKPVRSLVGRVLHRRHR